MKIKYKIEKIKEKTGIFKSSYIYRLYKHVISFNGIGFKKIYEGTYRECLKYCKEHNIELNKTKNV